MVTALRRIWRNVLATPTSAGDVAGDVAGADVLIISLVDHEILGFLLNDALRSSDALSAVPVQEGRAEKTVREAAMYFLEDIPALGTQHAYLMKQVLGLLTQAFFARHSPAFFATDPGERSAHPALYPFCV